MKEIEKLSRLRHILLHVEAIRSHSTGYGMARTDSAHLQISSDTGVSLFFEYAGDASRSDHEKVAPTRQYDGYEDDLAFKNSKKAAQRELNDFINGMAVPELRDEFASAVARIAKKAASLRHHGRVMAKTEEPYGVGAQKVEDRLAGNALYDLNKSSYAADPQALKALQTEASNISSDLNLSERCGYEDMTVPSYHEVSELYHQAKRESKISPV